MQATTEAVWIALADPTRRKPSEFASTLRDVVESIESGRAKRRPI
jgi:hypothetical protein